MAKGIMGDGGLLLLDRSSRYFSVIEENSTNTCIRALSLSP